HLQADGLTQVTFTSDRPFVLSRFQDWLAREIPAGVVRAKGVVAFREEPLARAIVNLSGRRRLSFEPDGRWEGPIAMHFVLIGRRMDAAAVARRLPELCAGSDG
ncbi:unnamed protein product, partial [Phaeothamnion confervicola]